MPTVIDFADAARTLQVVKVMNATHDAYSRPAFGEAEWAKCCALMLDLGYSIELSAALLGSRIARWAREDAVDYDAPTADDLARFLRSPAGLSALSYEMAA